jgi:hypothetical protein
VPNGKRVERPREYGSFFHFNGFEKPKLNFISFSENAPAFYLFPARQKQANKSPGSGRLPHQIGTLSHQIGTIFHQIGALFHQNRALFHQNGALFHQIGTLFHQNGA